MIADFHDYMVIKRGCSKRTAVEYCNDLRALERMTGQEPIKASTEDLDAFLMACSKRNCKAVTVRRKIASFRAFFRWAVKTKKIAVDPSIPLEGPKVPKRIPHVLSKSDVEMILNCRVAGKSEHDRRRDKAIMEVLYAAGVRREEVTRMNVEHLDFAEHSFRVIGKGNKERVCFMDKRCEDALRDYLELRPGVSSGALFVGRRGVRLGVRQLWAIFKQIVKLSGVSAEAVRISSPHIFRHAFATHLLERGADLISIQKFLGHASVATTERYCNVSQSHMRSVYEQFH